MANTETPVLEIKDEGDAFIVQHSPNLSTTQSQVELAAVSNNIRKYPQQMSRWYKWYISALVCIILYLTVTTTSEILSPFAQALSEEFNVNGTLVKLTITNFNICFCLGPLLWCPLSEHYGRRPVYLLCFTGFTICQACAAVSQNAPSIVIFRFLAGLFGSACLPLASAVLTDSWEVEIREKEMGIYLLNIISPSNGVMFGAFLARKGLGWRGTCWLLSVVCGVCTILVILTLRETHRPMHIKPKDDTAMSKETTDSNRHAYASLEPSVATVAVKARLWHVAVKPYSLLLREPILLISAMYFAMIGASTTIFIQVSVVAFFAFPNVVKLVGSLGVITGCTVGLIIHNIIIYPRFYLPKVRAVAPERVQPEVRLVLAIWAAPLFAVCFFWFGWTMSPSIHVAVPIIASLLLGISAIWLMQVTLNYIVDIFENTVATAAAWCTVLMYTFITVITVCSVQVFEALGIRWILTLVGCIAVTLIPVPILLTRYGPALRAKSGGIR